MHIPTFETLLWGLGTALKFLLCILLVYRRVYRRLPLFTIYAVLLLAEVIFVWFAYRTWGYRSNVAWYAYWFALAVVLMARGLVIAELCWVSLGNYPGVWSLARKILGLATAALLASALVSAALDKDWIVGFVLTTERGLELAASAILLLLLAVSIRYKVCLGPMERCILIGLAIYSIFQMLNRTFMSPLMTPYFHWWESVRIACFDIAVLMWLYPLRKPLPNPPAPPALISSQVASELMHGLLEQMRALTEELKDLLKVIWK